MLKRPAQDAPFDYWEDRADLLAGMTMVRAVELHLLDMFGRGKLSGTVHTCLGQEACAIGMAAALDPARDIVFANHRGHGHYLGYCGDVEGLMAEVAGLPSGVCGGAGGSQHLQRGNFYTNGIQGAGAPIVAGMALAEKRKRSNAIAVLCLGDGTFGEGTVYESMNIAALWSLPVVFLVEDNAIAQTTPSAMQHAGDLAERATPFGIPVVRADGQDVVAVYSAASEVVAAARSGAGPQMLYLDTCRIGSHSKGDDTRSVEEVVALQGRDPIGREATRTCRTEAMTQMMTKWTQRLNEIERNLYSEKPDALS